MFLFYKHKYVNAKSKAVLVMWGLRGLEGLWVLSVWWFCGEGFFGVWLVVGFWCVFVFWGFGVGFFLGYVWCFVCVVRSFLLVFWCGLSICLFGLRFFGCDFFFPCFCSFIFFFLSGREQAKTQNNSSWAQQKSYYCTEHAQCMCTSHPREMPSFAVLI